ncbi:hypothetical protein [Desulfoplanes sp.]
MKNNLKYFDTNKHIFLYIYTGIIVLTPPSIWTFALHFKAMQDNENAAITLLMISIVFVILTLYLTIRCAKKERQIRYIKSTPFIISGIIASILGSLAFSSSGFVTATYLYEVNKILFFTGLLVFLSGRSVFTSGCSILAMNKGRPPQLGWLGGIAGLCGLLILWVIPKKNSHGPIPTPHQENQKKS